MRDLRGAVVALVLVGAMTATGCSFFGGGQQSGAVSEMSPVAGSPAANETTTPGAGSTPAATAATTPGPRTPVPPGAGSPTPGGSASVDVTPSEVTASGMTLTLGFQPARHMFDQAAGNATPTDPAQSQDQNKANVGSAVFPGGMLHVANNFDAAQGAPADTPQAILRHVVLQVKMKDGGQMVPYATVTMDVLLDGRPVIFDQALVPMVAVDQNTRQLYYGNNVKFPSRGTYQVFVRMQPNPLIGQDQPPAAQFNVTIR